MSMFSRFFRFALLGLDTEIRHQNAVKLFGDPHPKTILDVGGSKYLKWFLPHNVKVMVTNFDTGDVFSNGNFLPFASRSFDAVVALDVIEHITRDKRMQFIDELTRVCRNEIVLSAPYGSEEHISHEYQLMNTIMLKHNLQIPPYLKEHIQYGLPTPLEVNTLATICGANVFYEGDFRFASRLGIPTKPSPKFRISILQTILQNMITKLTSSELLLSKQPNKHTNRFYIRIQVSI